MKLLAFAFTLFTFMSSALLADTFATGTYSIKAKLMHKDTYTGSLTAESNGSDVTKVTLKLDKKVMGSDTYQAKEQWGAQVNDQLLLYFSLEGTPHKWYYVFVTELEQASVNKFSGKVYKVKESAAKLKEILADGASQEELKDWKEVGEAKLQN